MELLNKDITDKVLRAFYDVYNDLGFGFDEKVYENALIIELTEHGLTCESQKAIQVYYKERKVGIYYADIVVDGKVILEIKAATSIIPEHEAQLLNYLKATDVETGLVLNFGKIPQFRRKVFTNREKNPRKSA